MSGLRCKPGDLAIVVHGPAEIIGSFVEVLYVAPANDFQLPDGHLHAGAEHHRWVVRFAREIEVPLAGLLGSSTRMTRYSLVPDWALRPIRPDADEPATETEREKEAA